MTLLSFLLVLFILLKVFNIVAWSWVIVLIPAYIIGFICLVFLIIFLFAWFKGRDY